MNSPSNRRHAWSWSWLPVAFSCCGLLFVSGAAIRATAQEKPDIAPSEPRESQVLSPDAAAAGAKPSPAPEFLPRLSPNEQKILSALSDSTEVALTDTPLNEAINYLKDLHGIEIWIDNQSLNADGIASDQLVSLNISGIALQSALRLILEPLLLTYVIEDDVLKITTQDAGSKRHVTRTYPVGDLFDSREEANELVEVIVSGLGLDLKEKKAARPVLSAPAATPNGATQTKELGTIAVSVKARAIVARQTHAVHDQIQQLLRDLREAKSLVPTRPAAEIGAPRSPKFDEFSPGLDPDEFNKRGRGPAAPPEKRSLPQGVPAPPKPATPKQV